MMPSSSFGPSLESPVVESAQISWISPLSASLIFLDLALVIGPTGTCNGSFNSTCWFSSKDYLEVYIYILLPKKKNKAWNTKISSKKYQRGKDNSHFGWNVSKTPNNKKNSDSQMCCSDGVRGIVDDFSHCFD